MQWRCAGSGLVAASYLAKLLNAADCGLMHSGTRLVFNCSAMNLCISSAIGKSQHERLLLSEKLLCPRPHL